MVKKKMLSKQLRMNKISLVALCSAFLSCETNNTCKLPEVEKENFRTVNVAYSLDRSCPEIEKISYPKVYFSFFNEWNERVIVSRGGKVIFCDSLTTDRSTAITGKGFEVDRNGASTSDLITFHLLESKIVFDISFSYDYTNVNLFKISDEWLAEKPDLDPVRAEYSNCIKTVF